jgi:prepilin-type N-terminal cleavage/methylation domain-containing protein
MIRRRAKMRSRARFGIGRGLFGNSKGFTLIEMAIVLIIIGIIIGAVIKGKDIIRSGEMKRLYLKYAKAWDLAYVTYHDRSGWILGDEASDTNDTGARDGRCNPSATEGNLVSQLQRLGIDLPPPGPTNSRLVRTYTDSTGRSNTLSVAFDYRTAQGNYIRVAGVPNELGIAWDRIVDGENSGATGDLLYVSDYTAVTLAPVAWPSAQTVPTANAAAILRLPF